MLNKVTLIGRLGADPDVRTMPNGGTITHIGLATNRRWKDKETGERKEETEWHRVCFFGRIAEVAGEYLRKGSLVYIEGRIHTNKWQDQSGQDRYTTEIIAGQMQMLESKSGGTEPLDSEPMNENQAPAKQVIQPLNNQALPESPPTTSYENFDDDIPF